MASKIWLRAAGWRRTRVLAATLGFWKKEGSGGFWLTEDGYKITIEG